MIDLSFDCSTCFWVYIAILWTCEEVYECQCGCYHYYETIQNGLDFFRTVPRFVLDEVPVSGAIMDLVAMEPI